MLLLRLVKAAYCIFKLLLKLKSQSYLNLPRLISLHSEGQLRPPFLVIQIGYLLLSPSEEVLRLVQFLNIW
jgi:hypothetical protein